MKKNFFALPIILLLAASCDLASKNLNQETPTTTQNTELSTTSKTPTSALTPSFKIYSDSDYDFTFEYPADSQIFISGQQQETDPQIKHISIKKDNAIVKISVITPKSYQAAMRVCEGGLCSSSVIVNCEQRGSKSCIGYVPLYEAGDTEKQAFIVDPKTDNTIQMTTSFSLEFKQLDNVENLLKEGGYGTSEEGDTVMQKWVNLGKIPRSDYEQIKILNQVYATFKFIK